MDVYKIINKLYDKTGFLEKYGGSLWITIIFFIIFFYIISYYHILNNIQPIKADWVNQRCSPTVIPFAGIINPPPDGKETPFEFTANNFSNCVYGILNDIIGVFLAPFYYLTSSFGDIFSMMTETLNIIRKMIFSIRTSILKVGENAFNRLLNVMIPIQYILMKVKDLTNKAQGVVSAGVFTLFGLYQTIVASIGAIIKIASTILISIAVIILVLYLIPFGLGIPFAIALLIVFIALLIPSILVYIISVMILKKWINPLPGIPSCFEENTLLKMDNGSMMKIKDIQVGMFLENKNEVTSTMKMACMEQMYVLNDIIVSGKHKVNYQNKFIEVEKHPHSYIYEKSVEKVYCLNTSKKIIKVQDLFFSDYDDLSIEELSKLRYNCSNYLPELFSLDDIHKCLDGGFHKDTHLELTDGHSVNITNVQINDVLKFGERVVGIVKIKASDLNCKEYYLADGYKIKGGPNLQISDVDLGKMTTLNMHGEQIKENYLYHLVTDKKSFYVNGIRFSDYNGCIDNYLDLENNSFLPTML